MPISPAKNTIMESLTKGQKAVIELQNNFIAELQALNLGFNESLSCRIKSSRLIELGVLDKEQSEGVYMSHLWASDINLYAERKTGLGLGQDRSINFGSSGQFTPENEACYWRTIHAAIILLNWDTIMALVEKYCTLYTEGSEKLRQEQSN